MDEVFIKAKEQANLDIQRGDVEAVVTFLDTYSGHPHFQAPGYAEAGCDWAKNSLYNARQLVKHKHCFKSWKDYASFQAQLKTDTQLHQFEMAADAIATGDLARLTPLIALDPDLIQMRSMRGHQATLLNYVGANGTEDWRQKTPANAVEIAQVLLKAGAEVDAWGAMYGGTSTLGLVATSVHPVKSGVQRPLMEILIKHGADPNHAVAPTYTEGLLILACIHNGRYEPIHYLAAHGAKVDMEAAGALGDFDKVKLLFDGASLEKRAGSLCWACQYGHWAIIEYLLEKGVPVNVRVNGMTPLLSAAFDGQLNVVNRLLILGADIELTNSYGGSALGQTLWCLYNHRKPHHLELMELFISRGAWIDPEWLPYIEEQRKQAP